jgi:hypothetical protein
MKDWATSDQVLKDQTGLTLEERCVFFHRQFPELRISRSTLRTIYREVGIKKKKVRLIKNVSHSKKKNPEQLVS